MSRRHRRAIRASTEPAYVSEPGEGYSWAPNSNPVKHARAHLAAMTPERRAQLEGEWL